MIRKGLIGLLLFVLLTAFTAEKNDYFPYVKNESFTHGETLKFKMTYGIFTVGRGAASIDPNTFVINERPCFKIEVTAETVGLVNWVTDIKNRYGAYVDTMAIVPHMFYRNQREGNYKKDEQTYFDHPNRTIKVSTADRKTGQYGEPVVYEAPPQVRDMISGFLYLRLMDFSKLKPRDTVVIKGFFEDEFYALKIVYQGKQTIKTKVGKVRTVVFKPVMPKNQLFDGENSITAFFSDDKNRIPVKIDAEMFIGSAGVELTSYSNLRNPLNLVK